MNDDGEIIKQAYSFLLKNNIVPQQLNIPSGTAMEISLQYITLRLEFKTSRNGTNISLTAFELMNIQVVT
jgi:hypothetical protein